MFGQEGWIIALLTFFMDLHFVSIHGNAEKIFSRRIYSHLHLTLRQERMFICTYEWQVKFFLQFLASGFIYQTTRILFLKMNCLSLNIVPWLPFVNFHFSWMNLHNYSVRQIKLQVSNHYSSFKLLFCQTDQASRVNRVSQKNTGLLPRMSKINDFPLFRKRCSTNYSRRRK